MRTILVGTMLILLLVIAFLFVERLAADQWSNSYVTVTSSEGCSTSIVKWTVQNVSSAIWTVDIMATNNGRYQRKVANLRPGKKLALNANTNALNHVSEVYVQVFPTAAGSAHVWAGTFNETGGCDPAEHF